jgi:hypothetical protein
MSKEIVPNPNPSIDDGKIRRTRHKGEWYYSTIDTIADMFDMDYWAAQNYYHVLKNRVVRNGEVIVPNLVRLKLRAADGKMRRTDCADSDGIKVLRRRLEKNIHDRDKRVNHRQDDEVVNFHPKIIEFLKENNWCDIQHHVKLPSGNIIDIVARNSSKEIHIIECKPNLRKGNLYTAVGQALCYCAEYALDSTPAIACYYSKKNDYARQSCEALGIDLFEIKRGKKKSEPMSGRE